MPGPVVCLSCPPGGKRLAVTRGCCGTCYHRHRLAVARGETTWGALEAAGAVLPAARKNTRGLREAYLGGSNVRSVQNAKDGLAWREWRARVRRRKRGA